MTHPHIPCAVCTTPVRVIGDEGAEEAVWCPECGALQRWGYSAEEGLERPRIFDASMHASMVRRHIGHDVTFGKGGSGARCSTCHEDMTAAQGLAVLYDAAKNRPHLPTTLKLFFWEDVRAIGDWAEGDAVALAATKEQAVDLIVEAYTYGADTHSEETLRLELTSTEPTVSEEPVGLVFTGSA